ncbi:DUF485 domain-containing protein [Rhodococcus opacus]|uniref:DUF485 domain-containing protein n=1 Tax=Rhodococcus opacus TaxID=37919 RepID=UPI0029539494|nr:DUF485 domain-containing protein [Rhodococcus opacus]MDV7090501.1 DUF485 domain-containing protein [Rhodococcus opacus]
MASPLDASAASEAQICDFVRLQSSSEFQALKSRHRRFVFPVAVVALACYGTYISLAAFAHSFMSITVFGNITIGLILGFLQIVMTFAVTLAYVAYANRVLDPPAARLRAETETDSRDRDGFVEGVR